MLEVIKRWFAPRPVTVPWLDVADWAQRQHHVFKRTRQGDGFAVDGAFEGRAWRLEWGPPQRTYIEGSELRMRMELSLPSVLQMLVLSRPLMESLEHESFERFTEVTQTQVDVATSEEMRWLAMFEKAGMAASKKVKSRFAAVSNDPRLAAAWVADGLAAQLERAADTFLQADPAFVLMTLRGRVYLRMQSNQPTVAVIEEVVRLFATACLEALRVADGLPQQSEDWPSTGTGSTAWQSQLHPEEPEGHGP